MEFSFENVLIPKRRIIKTAEKLKPEIKNVANATSKGFDDNRASINMPNERNMLSKVEQVIRDNS